MFIPRIALLSIAALAVFSAPIQAQEGGNTKRMDAALAAGWKAHFICSATFNAGQSLDEIEKNELDGMYPDFQSAYNQLPAARIDKSAKRVSVSYAGDMPPRISTFRPGFGCSQLPIGAKADAIRWLPRFQNWVPAAGTDRGNAIGSNVRIDLKTDFAERIEAPLAFAFDERTYGDGTRTSAVVIVHDGQIVGERYARGIDHETPQRTWSVAKSITATILGAARHKGLVGLDTPAVVSAWNNGGDPRREITLRHLMHMASGLDSGQNGSRTDRIYFGGGRVVDHALHNSLEAMPGTRFKYANNDTLAALRHLRESMKDDAAYHQFPYAAVLNKIGARRTTLETDWSGDFIGSSQVWSTARDLARIGQLYVQDGFWGGEQILAKDWRRFVSTPAPAQPAGGNAGYGAFFWLMNNTSGVPSDTFYAAGNRGQYIVIVPSLKTVIVRRGYDINGGARFDIHAFSRDVIGALKAAIAERAAEQRAEEEAEIALQRAAEARQAAAEAAATERDAKRDAVRERMRALGR